MSEMIERVARAIFSTNYHPSDGEFASRMFDNDEHPQEKRRAYRAARAAIEAMRGYTLDMWSAGNKVFDDHCITPRVIAPVYEAMIDAALPTSACDHDWMVWPETDGQEQRCMKCGAHRRTPFSVSDEHPSGEDPKELRGDSPASAAASAETPVPSPLTLEGRGPSST